MDLYLKFRDKWESEMSGTQKITSIQDSKQHSNKAKVASAVIDKNSNSFKHQGEHVKTKSEKKKERNKLFWQAKARHIPMKTIRDQKASSAQSKVDTKPTNEKDTGKKRKRNKKSSKNQTEKFISDQMAKMHLA